MTVIIAIIWLFFRWRRK